LDDGGYHEILPDGGFIPTTSFGLCGLIERVGGMKFAFGIGAGKQDLPNKAGLQPL